MPQTSRLAQHLADLRAERGLSLDQLSEICGVSRASLARIEKAQVSPTTETLGKLCSAYGLSMSRLLALVENEFRPVITASARQRWTDPETGFHRDVVSDAAAGLTGEVLLCHLPAFQTLQYDRPPRPGLEHHLLLLHGALTVTVEARVHSLTPGDCLRYKLFGQSAFQTGETPADYYLYLL
ncbi:helix-turn-helix transcriptional regulator [Thalassovita sp.]|uniref:helix-turn-helix domain-containing protein n=1 Tax=Thalassovita sp. TaxID=1979401 RepID=UPI002B267D89|nr:helix-turn-helix transcriptional regulator [Thalassovita sp.]